MPFHSDSEDSLVPNTSIGCIVFGNPRELALKNKEDGKLFTLKLKSGSCYSMIGEQFQKLYVHSVPIVTNSKGDRYSLTFRTLKRPIDHEETDKETYENNFLEKSKQFAKDVEEAKLLSVNLKNFVENLQKNISDVNSNDNLNIILSSVSSLINSISDSLVAKIERVEEQCKNVLNLLTVPKTDTATVKIAQLENKMHKLEDELDNQDQYNRRLNVVVFGIKEYETENTDYIAADLGRVMGLRWAHPSIFQRTHRLGRKVGNKPRPIIIRFLSLRAKDAFINAAFHANKQKGYEHFQIKENLTKSRLEILKGVLDLKKEHKVFNVYTRDGVIIVHKSVNSEPLFIRNREEFLKLKNC